MSNQYHNHGKPPKPTLVDKLFTLNVSPLASGILLGLGVAAIIFALACMSGCNYSAIKTEELNRAKIAAEKIAQVGELAKVRAKAYKAAGNEAAASEAGNIAKIGEFAQENIIEPLATAKAVPEIALDAAGNAAGLASGVLGGPWLELALAAFTAVVGTKGVTVAKAKFWDGPKDYERAVRRVTNDPLYGKIGEAPDLNDPKDLKAIRAEMPSRSHAYFYKRHPSAKV